MDKRRYLKQYQPGGTLSEGEETRVHRIRASKELHEWLASMTAAQRGLLLQRLHQLETDVTTEEVALEEEEPTQTISVVTPVQARRAARPSMRKGGVKRTSTERLALHVPALGVIQKCIPRGLGWKPERYERAEKMLSEGDIMYAEGVNYRTELGSVMDYRTVEALVRLGVLAPA